jgi:hypothetical protein
MARSLRTLLAASIALGIISAAVVCQNSSPSADEPAVPQAARYWKGNLHTHSLWSDGDDYPEMIADWYKSHGYQFLAMTDHNRLSDGERWVDAEPKSKAGGAAMKKYLARFGDAWVERREEKGKAQVRLKPLSEFHSLLDEAGRFLMIPGEEISHSYAKLPVHINAINLRDAIKPVDGDGIAETIRINHRAVAEQRRKTGWKIIASLNHPNFGWGIRAEDMILTDELKFFEVFNGHPSVRNYGDALHIDCEKMWDIVLALRLGKHRLPIVYGLATDDAHGYHVYGLGRVNPGRGWVMVRASHLSAEAIVRAMEAGDFYASTGVILNEVKVNGTELRLSIKAEPGVTYKTQFIATLKDAKLDSEPRFGPDGQELKVTRIYSDEIGKVVAEVQGTEAKYVLTGKELYVRAKVISSKPHPNPYAKGDAEVAWTQPVAP